MKKRLSFFSLLALVSFCQAQSQTVKRIHLSGGAEVTVPIDLVDSVRFIEEGESKLLRVFQESGNNISIAVSEIDSITHIPSAELNLELAQLGELVLTSVSGVVRNSEGLPVFGARVKSGYGTEEVFTDNNGVFFLNDIVVYNRLGYITITKEGYHEASRSFLPLESGSNRVNIQLLPMELSGSFSSTSGGIVSSNLLQLDFPANAIEQNGQAYTGTVNVYAVALDPSSPEMFDQMPGELLGGMNDSLQMLRSVGMAAVELRDENMNELQLAEGGSVALTFNIPSALQADAPETIDWWSFDEALGIWMHEGVAQRQGNQYLGQASHFSWWNCDVPENFNDFNGSINTVDGDPISDAQVNVVSPTLGTGTTYTNAEGLFTGRVPKNQTHTLNINLTCNTTNDWVLAYSESIVSGTEVIEGNYTPSSVDERYTISGTIINCEGLPVESGYARVGGQIFLANEGEFSIQTCAMGEYSLRTFDTSNPDTIKVSGLISVQVESGGAEVGSLETCSEIYGSVTDIDGNVYATVLIGEQWWMAENIKTTRFADGSEIPHVTDNTEWSDLSTPGWCNYENSVVNDIVYGKLYNWFTVNDPRNVCPTGWHVPTDNELTVLIDFLGGEDIAGSKMKRITGWNAPNTNATNESGFSGLPGGYRSSLSGGFSNVGAYGHWWSSTEGDTDFAWSRNLFYFNDTANRFFEDWQNGFSVRCVKD